MTEEEAKQLVARHVAEQNSDYPTDDLAAERFSIGWMVAAGGDPADVNSLLLGAPIFLIGDNGVIEQYQSSVSPEEAVADFTERHGSLLD